MSRVVVAGASGLLGREVVASLLERGDDVVALAHRTPIATAHERLTVLPWSRAEDAMRDADVVYSGAGASVSPSFGGRAGYDRVDVPVNTSLIELAERARVRKMVYVAVAAHELLGDTRYVAAHEEVVRRLRRSSMASCIVRPTGIFGALAPFVSIVRWRIVPNMAGGRTRTNPVHERDVAEQCVRAIHDDVREIEIGGPDVMTRAEIFDLAMATVGVRAWKVSVPVWLVRWNAALLSVIHPRLGQFTAFMAALATRDAVAPALGTRHLADYFRVLAAR